MRPASLSCLVSCFEIQYYYATWHGCPLTLFCIYILKSFLFLLIFSLFELLPEFSQGKPSTNFPATLHIFFLSCLQSSFVVSSFFSSFHLLILLKPLRRRRVGFHIFLSFRTYSPMLYVCMCYIILTFLLRLFTFDSALY